MPVQQRKPSSGGASAAVAPPDQRTKAATRDGEAKDLRVGHAEREEVVRQLATHCGDGRLSIDELDERLAAVWSARTRKDLQDVMADLPPAPPAEASSPTWRSVVADGRSLLLGMPLRVLATSGAALLLWLVFLFLLAQGHGYDHSRWAGQGP